MTIANPAGHSVAILGVGNRLRGDDAVGCLVCDALGAEPGKDSPPRHQDTKLGPESDAPLGDLGGCTLPNSVFVLDCGNTPENYLQPIADRKPSRILVVDCCDFGKTPGGFHLFTRPEIEQLSYGLMSTHTLPLTLTIEMLSLETNATIELLGIQPERMEFGEALSEPVRHALPSVVEFVRQWARLPQPRA